MNERNKQKISDALSTLDPGLIEEAALASACPRVGLSKLLRTALPAAACLVLLIALPLGVLYFLPSSPDVDPIPPTDSEEYLSKDPYPLFGELIWGEEEKQEHPGASHPGASHPDAIKPLPPIEEPDTDEVADPEDAAPSPETEHAEIEHPTEEGEKTEGDVELPQTEPFVDNPDMNATWNGLSVSDKLKLNLGQSANPFAIQVHSTASVTRTEVAANLKKAGAHVHALTDRGGAIIFATAVELKRISVNLYGSSPDLAPTLFFELATKSASAQTDSPVRIPVTVPSDTEPDETWANETWVADTDYPDETWVVDTDYPDETTEILLPPKHPDDTLAWETDIPLPPEYPDETVVPLPPEPIEFIRWQGVQADRRLIDAIVASTYHTYLVHIEHEAGRLVSFNPVIAEDEIADLKGAQEKLYGELAVLYDRYDRGEISWEPITRIKSEIAEVESLLEDYYARFEDYPGQLSILLRKMGFVTEAIGAKGVTIRATADQLIRLSEGLSEAGEEPIRFWLTLEGF